MSSIHTNSSAMAALTTLRNINKSLDNTQNRISSGLKIESGRDNAAYFAISETMNGDSRIYKAIDESLTLTQNSISAARLGAETVVDLANDFVERVAFAQGGTAETRADVQKELDELVARIGTTISQATFNGSDLVNATTTVTVVTGISRASTGTITTTSVTFQQQDLGAIQSALAAIDLTSGSTSALMEGFLQDAEAVLGAAIASATALGIAEKSVEMQKEFLGELTNRIDTGVGSMIDADMEAEAARLTALQVQQQLATQALAIANTSPQNILTLFR